MPERTLARGHYGRASRTLFRRELCDENVPGGAALLPKNLVQRLCDASSTVRRPAAVLPQGRRLMASTVGQNNNNLKTLRSEQLTPRIFDILTWL